MSQIPQLFLLDRVTTGTSRPMPVPPLVNGVLNLVATSEGTTSGGTLLAESSDLPSYTGTWNALQTLTASEFTGGAKKVYPVEVGAGLWVRVRVNSTITGGGTVTVTANA